MVLSFRVGRETPVPRWGTWVPHSGRLGPGLAKPLNGDTRWCAVRMKVPALASLDLLSMPLAQSRKGDRTGGIPCPLSRS